jgi:hypothetical protein
MGKTVESYRLALEIEIQKWNGFARALRIEDRDFFEQIMDICRNYASAGSNATRPVIFQPMIISILLYHHKKLIRLEKELNAFKQGTVKC